MNNDNYELMPLDEVKKLKDEINELKKEKHYAPSSVVAQSLDRLANSLESLFKIFDVAATDIEQETIQRKSFEEHVNPILDKLNTIAEQNRDIAEGMLALADIVKELDSHREKVKTYGGESERKIVVPEPINNYPQPRPMNIPPMPPGNMPPIPRPMPR